MKKHFSKLLVALFICMLGTMMIATSVITASAAEANTPAQVSSEESTIYCSGTCGTNLVWEIDVSGMLTIYGTGAMDTYEYGSAPWYVYRSIITKINVSNDVTSISNGAFYGCSNVEEMSIPFVGTSLTATGKDSVLGIIFGYTWQGSSGTVRTYDIDGKMMSDYYSSSNNSHSSKSTDFVAMSLEGTNSDNGVWQYSCHDYKSGSCYWLRSYYYYIPSNLKKIEITNATSLAESAFLNCINLETVILNTDIKSIDQYAFANCSSIETFEIPQSTTNISNYLFYKCTSLSGLKMHSDIISIGHYAFYQCEDLTNITFPKNLSSIGDYAFYKCTSFTKIDINSNIRDIGTYAFCNCSNVTNLEMENGIVTIGEYSFQGLNLLKKITVPNSVTNIGVGSFQDCSNLEEITLPFIGTNSNASDKNSVFGIIFGYDWHGSSSNSRIYDVDGKFYSYATNYSTKYYDFEPYNTAELKWNGGVWQYSCYDYPVTMNGGGTKYFLRSYYYYVPTALKKVTLTNATSISETAFLNCSNISELNLNAGCTYSGNYTFYNSGLKYSVKFLNFDGSVLDEKIYTYGDHIILPSFIPTRAADKNNTYKFAGWDKEIAVCTSDDTYTAFYTATPIDYTVVFKDYDGTVLSTQTYHYGDVVIAPTTPTRENDAVGSYTFKAWDNTVINCEGDAIYTATYDINYTDYTVIFKNDDGSVLSTNTYHYGDTIIQPETPTKASDKVYSYSFKAWDKVIVKCEGDAIYIATYTPTYIEYTVEFVDEDNTPISTRTYHYGDTIVAPTTPTKASDNTYNYTFAGWDKEVTNCDGNATYKATYNATYINYTVTFKNYKGDVISTNTYHYGDAVVVPSNPKKPSDANYCYVFVGWDKSVTNCYGDAVYTAKFTASDLPIATVDNSSARANETVVVNILLSGAPNLGSLAISDISYNTSAFELVSFDWKVADAILSNWDAATGKGALALSTSKDINGTIISLTFKVKDGTADGNYPVSCIVTSQECDFKNVAGQITVYSVAPGDVDGNESVDKDDAIYLLMHSFFPEDYPINQEADYNGNGMVDKDDAIHLLMYTFFPDDYPLAPAPAAVTITTTEERKKEEEE